LALVILFELRFAEVIFLLRQAEKESRHEIFISCMKYLLPLFSSTHSTKYVLMLSDLLVDWYCSSDAEKIIFAKAILTRKTVNGANIFTDRYVEWMMKDMRIWLGKYASVHHKSLVKQVALTLYDRKNSSRKEQVRWYGLVLNNNMRRMVLSKYQLTEFIAKLFCTATKSMYGDMVKSR
jgi:hypothetical protein